LVVVPPRGGNRTFRADLQVTFLDLMEALQQAS
jgi:hypothetical protein